MRVLLLLVASAAKSLTRASSCAARACSLSKACRALLQSARLSSSSDCTRRNDVSFCAMLLLNASHSCRSLSVPRLSSRRKDSTCSSSFTLPSNASFEMRAALAASSCLDFSSIIRPSALSARRDESSNLRKASTVEALCLLTSASQSSRIRRMPTSVSSLARLISRSFSSSCLFTSSTFPSIVAIRIRASCKLFSASSPLLTCLSRSRRRWLIRSCEAVS
mmetsp:Transcript_39946/g.64766  ORF Transcript_39946/g.64766 Transcript_39946/m.64766 type:complete len:221 (-) Transcript_39946:3330-3992(-)